LAHPMPILSDLGEVLSEVLMRRSAISLIVCLACLWAPGHAHGQAKKYPWQKEAGPIAGRWKATCARSAGLIIQFDRVGEKQAVGRIAALGQAAKYHYKQGEEIFRVEATDLGKWVGQLKWRSVAGVERWDPVTLIATDSQLDAVMTTDDCYKNMPRVR